jgi:hypothetical protein
VLTSVTITGSFVDPDSSEPRTISGTATLSQRLVNGTQIVEPEPVAFQGNASGQVVNLSGLALTLVAVDDTGTEPKTAYYTFAITVDSAPLDPFTAVISHTSGTVDLSTLMPVMP